MEGLFFVSVCCSLVSSAPIIGALTGFDRVCVREGVEPLWWSHRSVCSRAGGWRSPRVDPYRLFGFNLRLRPSHSAVTALDVSRHHCPRRVELWP
jgi:hypothetical protein